MGFLHDLANWARDTWRFITGGVSDIGAALTKLWHYITSLHNLLAWITGVPVLDAVRGLTGFAGDLVKAYTDMYYAVARIAVWILNHLIMPWVQYLLRQIAILRAKEAADVRMLIALDIEDLKISEAYTEKLTGIERAARIKDVNAARAYALALTVALHQAIEREAASGYTEDWHNRLGLVGKIADQLASHDPAVRDLVAVLVRGALALAEVDSPAARWALGIILTRLVNRLGVDKVTGDLLAALLGPLTSRGKPSNLHDAMHDIDARLAAMESTWAEFMDHGGSEVEQAGSGWKNLTSPLTDAALLGVFGLAVTNPRAFATGVTDTIGVTANGAVTGVLNLLRKA